ncbi:MAG TPA: class I SAM-dependent methyltransferase [Chthoniobacterales bacterium]|nr:class I SAM-dependent methyltransferase [Chthoniobacterales bacterium]
MGRTRLLPRVWRHRRKRASQLEPWPIPLYGIWDEIAGFAAEIRASDFMAEMMRRRAAHGSAGLMGALDCATLYALTRWRRPRGVVESGGFVGLAASFILKALADAGVMDAKLYSIESDENCAHGELIPDPLRRQFVPLRAKVQDVIRADTLPPKIDMFLHDSSHRYRHMLWEFREFWPRLRDGGLLVSHDVHMNAAFASFVVETYAHDKKTGVLDRSRTAHEEWGRWGYIGFMIKKADRANV